MPLVCIHCSMKAMLANEPPPSFEETPDEHLARLHPDLEVTKRERIAMEQEMRERWPIPRI